MLESSNYIVVAHIRPKPGASEKLLGLREQLVKEFAGIYPMFVSATIYSVEGSDEWRDVVVFSERPPLDPPNNAPVYDEWSKNVDGLSYELFEPVKKA